MRVSVNDREAIRVSVPGRLEYREVAVRAVAAASRLVGGRQNIDRHADQASFDLSNAFDAELVSAFSEVFNNVVMHSYQLRTGRVDIEIAADDTGITLQLTDGGTPFDISDVPSPELDSMPDHGLGIHIAKSAVALSAVSEGCPRPDNDMRCNCHYRKIIKCIRESYAARPQGIDPRANA
jgi:anti-sigma regulatory factor (Ser/Thr protein kinase)